MSVAVSTKKVRATVRLPQPLYDEARSFVEREVGSAESINDFFVAAICAYVKCGGANKSTPHLQA